MGGWDFVYKSPHGCCWDRCTCTPGRYLGASLVAQPPQSQGCPPPGNPGYFLKPRREEGTRAGECSGAGAVTAGGSALLSHGALKEWEMSQLGRAGPTARLSPVGQQPRRCSYEVVWARLHLLPLRGFGQGLQPYARPGWWRPGCGLQRGGRAASTALCF